MVEKSKFYRPDIDGLRALAVVLVVLYHAGFNISGGFVGVDVFFVISGFLITGIVYREVQEQRFSFANFYNRRIKRLIPAFMVVAIGTILMIRWFYFPSDYEDFAKSMQKALLGCFCYQSGWSFIILMPLTTFYPLGLLN